jgi:perosamine synthetase
MSKRIPLSVPYLNGNEWKLLKECIQSTWVSSSGKFIHQFEDSIAKFTKGKYAIAVSSGTAALHLALKAVGVANNDEVIVPTVTFIAPINTVHYVNAHPVFMDCDEFYNIDSAKTIEFIETKTVFKNGFTFNKKSGRRISAIIPVHIFGNAVFLNDLMVLCKKRNIKIVEDATESLGTFYTQGKLNKKHAGTVGDIGCFSFNGNKMITAGGGGMVVTNHRSYAEKIRYLSTQAKDDELYYIHDEVGFNYRLSNLQAALGVSQMSDLPKILKSKQRIFDLYIEQVKDIQGLQIGQQPDYADNNSWLVALQIDKKRYGHSRDALIQLFRKENIEARPLWHLNHLQKPYKHCETFNIVLANRLLTDTVNLPSSSQITMKEIQKIAGLLKKWQK